MYSQYNQYQQPAAVTTSQSGLFWDGTKWIPSNAATTSTHSSYASAVTSNNNNTSLSQQYTQYYHLWKAKEQEQLRLSQTLPLNSIAQQEASRQAQWAKHYSDLSSIAAHYYHSHAPGTPVPTFPPAPPGATTAAAAVTQPAGTQQPQVVTQPQQQNDPPEGLKRFVHKCLQQCSFAEEKQQMQRLVEQEIAQAIQQGTMHTTDWDAKPLLSIKVDTAMAVQTSGGTAAAIRKFRKSGIASSPYEPSGSNDNNGSSYYGPSSQPASNVSSSADYYGPSTINTMDEDEKYKSKWKLQDKFPTGTNAKDFVSSDNYYGKTKDLGDDDFVSLSSHKISRKRKKTASQPIKVKKQVFTPMGGFERSSSALAKRASRFQGAGGISEATSVLSSTNEDTDRFMGLALIGGSKKLKESDYEHMKVKGMCTTLEKEYLRLTAPPRAERVRPEPILKKHLENLKEEWSSPKHRDYTWFCSQLKAVRQDLTVQQIANAFAVDVYETHARIALEEGDLNEYNQCQTQLKELYKTLHADARAIQNQNEFIAYRLIYYVFLQGNKKYKGGSSDLFNIMLSLTPEQRQDSFISHALEVRVAVAEYDYHAFFRLLKQSSRHGRVLMNYMVPVIRYWALQRICKAYRPTVSTMYVLQELGFDVDNELDFGKKWLASCSVVLSEDSNDVLAKDSVVRESDLTEKSSSLI